MTKTWTFSPAFIPLLLASCIAGCSGPPASAPDGNQEQTTASGSAELKSAGASKLTLTVGMIFGETQTFDNPDSTLIEKHVRATDWKNFQERPYIQLARPGAQRTSVLKVQGTLETPNVDGPFRAVLLLYNPDGTPWGAAESAPLESVDAAIDLLLLFRNDIEKLKTVAREWEGEFAE
jgi:hypothetical protein